MKVYIYHRHESIHIPSAAMQIRAHLQITCGEGMITLIRGMMMMTMFATRCQNKHMA
jgi:hypothetical protein